jgi:Protein of unknown function (DUF3237)
MMSNVTWLDSRCGDTVRSPARPSGGDHVPLDSLPCEYLFTLTIESTAVPAALIPDGPQGTRAVATVSGGSFEGPRLRGHLPPVAAGDWVTVRADGTYRLDVRLVLETDDGACVLMTYNGVGRPREGGIDLRTAPTFETGDERYAWLNHVQAVAIGRTGGPGVTYEVYALS